MKLTLVIPLFNEEKNIEKLVGEINQSHLLQEGLGQVILVNNGSADRTGDLLRKLSADHPWIKPIYLQENVNYGGGIQHGLGLVATDFAGFIPGDLQISIDDLKKVWNEAKSKAIENGNKLLVKGNRVTRLDSWNTRFVSGVYTILGNSLLGLRISDVNGLPKVFHIDLFKLVKGELQKTFVWDAQLILTARSNNWKIIEVPVTFFARRAGVSSWSGKRFKVYFQTFRKMLYLRGTR
jgi:dolichol-phosphate mannosyltransferase